MHKFEGEHFELVYLNDSPYDFFDSFFIEGVNKLDFDVIRRYFKMPISDAVFFKLGRKYTFDEKSMKVEAESLDDPNLAYKLTLMPEWPSLNDYMEKADKWKTLDDVVHPSIVNSATAYLETSHLKYEISRRKALDLEYPNTHELLGQFSNLEDKKGFNLKSEWDTMVNAFSGRKQRFDNLLFWQLPMRDMAADVAHQAVFGQMIQDVWNALNINSGWTCTSENLKVNGSYLNIRIMMKEQKLIKDGKPSIHILLFFPYIRKDWPEIFESMKKYLFDTLVKTIRKKLR